MSPIFEMERKVDRAVHMLNWSLRAFPVKTRSQTRMSSHNLLPGVLEHGDVQLVIVKIENDLPDVETGVRLIEAVEQHALLHRRQAIRVLDTVAADDLCHRIRAHETAPHWESWGLKLKM